LARGELDAKNAVGKYKESAQAGSMAVGVFSVLSGADIMGSVNIMQQFIYYRLFDIDQPSNFNEFVKIFGEWNLNFLGETGDTRDPNS
jgi:uncharacterized membrane protein